jgi:hypothetical protein
MRATKWLGPAAVSIAAALLVAGLWQPAAERSTIGSGAAYTIATYDQVLPLLGLGIAMARLRWWSTTLATIIFIGGIPSGILGEARVLSAMNAVPERHNLFVFVGPLCCVAIGLALASPAGLRAWTVAVAAALSGAALGFLIALHDPTGGDGRFSGGAAAAGFWLVMTPAVLLRHVDGLWLTIGGRVVASWLIAMGLLLGGSSYVVMKRAERAAAMERTMPKERLAPLHRPAVTGAPL